MCLFGRHTFRTCLSALFCLETVMCDCFLQFTKYIVYRKCFFKSSTVLRQFLKIAYAKLLSVTASGTAQAERKQLNRPVSNLRINN